jgi:SPP1 family predicted phage head-tail adaptor
MTIAPSLSINDRPHRVTLQNPGPPVPNGDGSFTQTWLDLNPPAVWASIVTAPADLEDVQAGGTTSAMATHIITIPYHPQVTVRTRVLFNGRRFNVSGASSPEERHVDSVLVCEELK